MMMKTYHAPALVIIENNDWSLATQIHERRCPLKLDFFAATFEVPYYQLSGNDVYEYIELLQTIRQQALKNKTPVLVEVLVRTLGDWRMKTDECPQGKYINYHAGAAPTVECKEWPVIEESSDDPVHILTKHFKKDFLEICAKDIFAQLHREIA